MRLWIFINFHVYLKMPEVKIKDRRYCIEVHPDLIRILEKIRLKLKETTWDVMDKNITWRELTAILAKKINAKESLII